MNIENRLQRLEAHQHGQKDSPPKVLIYTDRAELDELEPYAGVRFLLPDNGRDPAITKPFKNEP